MPATTEIKPLVPVRPLAAGEYYAIVCPFNLAVHGGATYASTDGIHVDGRIVVTEISRVDPTTRKCCYRAPFLVGYIREGSLVARWVSLFEQNDSGEISIPYRQRERDFIQMRNQNLAYLLGCGARLEPELKAFVEACREARLTLLKTRVQ
jgi:hypothetical protein